MFLKHVREDFAKFAGESGLLETNVLSILSDGCGNIIFETDISDLESDLEDAKQELKDSDKMFADTEAELQTAKDKIEELEAELTTIKDEMFLIKDPTPDSTEHSIGSYRQRAIDAEIEMDKWKEFCHAANLRVEEMKKELVALRKRKGIEVGLLSCPHEVMNLLAQLSNVSDTAPASILQGYKSQAASVLKMIREKT